MTSAPESSQSLEDNISATTQELGVSSVDRIAEVPLRKKRQQGFKLKDGKRFKTALPDTALGTGRVIAYSIGMVAATVVCLVSFVCQIV